VRHSSSKGRYYDGVCKEAHLRPLHIIQLLSIAGVTAALQRRRYHLALKDLFFLEKESNCSSSSLGHDLQFSRDHFLAQQIRPQKLNRGEIPTQNLRYCSRKVNRMAAQKDLSEKELDDMLESALNEFDPGDSNDEGAVPESAGPEDASTEKFAEDLSKEMANFYQSLMSEKDFKEKYEETMRALTGGSSSGDVDVDALQQRFANLSNGQAGAPQSLAAAGGPQDFDRNMQNAVQMLQESAKALENMSPQEKERLQEQLMEKLAQQFSSLSENDQFANMMETMVKQMLSKDVMYPPLSQMRDKYPKWLLENRGKVPQSDYDRYSQQLDCVKEMCAAYDESDIDSDETYKKVVILMQKMQDCGQPPLDIIKEIAPGVEFDPATGMPRSMPGMPGGMPGMPGMPGLPGGDQCSIQ